MTAQFILGAIAGTCLGGLFCALSEWLYRKYLAWEEKTQQTKNERTISKVREAMIKLGAKDPVAEIHGNALIAHDLPKEIPPPIMPQFQKISNPERITIPVKRCKNGRFKKKKRGGK